MPSPVPEFDSAFRETFRALLAWRRDVRRFRREPLPEGLLEKLLAEACLAPSVGLSQPWRFVLVDEPARRREIRKMFESCNAEALAGYSGADAKTYARLKLAGLDEAPAQLAVFADRETHQGRGLGQRTMPETIEYSAVMAIHTLWLAARAENVGLGWVSILDPLRVARLLDVPQEWRFIAYLCAGYPSADSDTPELEREGWEKRRPGQDFILRR